MRIYRTNHHYGRGNRKTTEKEVKGYISILNDKCKTYSVFLTFLMVFALVTIFGCLTYKELTKRIIIIEPFEISEDIARGGFSGKIVANQLLNQIELIRNKKTNLPIRRDNKAYPLISKYPIIPKWSEEEVEVELPNTGISLQKLFKVIRSLWGNEPTKISGEVYKLNDQFFMTTRVTGKPDITINVKLDSLKNNLYTVAKDALKYIEPYQLLLYLYTNKERNDCLEMIKYCLTSERKELKSMAYAIWGRIETDDRKFEDAIEKYKRSLNIDSTNITAHIFWELSLEKQGRYTEAIEHCKTILSIDSNNVLGKNTWFYAHNSWGYSLNGLKQYKQAIDIHKKVIDRPHKGDAYPDAYADAYNNWGNSLRDSALYKGGDTSLYNQAIEKYKEAIVKNPDYAYAYNGYGDALRGKRQFKQAIDKYKIFLDLDSSNPDAYNNMGNSLRDSVRFKGGDTALYHQAIGLYQKAIAKDPNYVYAYNGYGDALKGLGQFDSAIKRYENAINAGPEYVEPYNNLANIFRDSTAYQRAIELYSRVIAIDKNYAYAYNGYGDALRLQGQFKQAIDKYKIFLDLDSSNPNVYTNAYNNMGNSLRDSVRFKGGDTALYHQAIGLYQKAIAKDPNYVYAYNGYGDALKGLGQFDSAIKRYENAIKVDPNFIAPYINCGNSLIEWANSKGGDTTLYKQAIERYRQVLVKDRISADKGLKEAFKRLNRSKGIKGTYGKVIQPKANNSSGNKDTEKPVKRGSKKSNKLIAQGR